MNNEDVTKKLDNLKTPQVKDLPHSEPLKLTILNARKSAALGVWLILIPAFFLFSVCMKYYFMQNWHIIDTFEEVMSSLDRSSSTHFLSPLLFVGFPMIAIVLNALSLLHIQLNRSTRELIVTVKLRWPNLLLLCISSCILGIFLLYAITETIRHSV